MKDLGGNPEDRFSHDMAQTSSPMGKDHSPESHYKYIWTFYMLKGS